MLLALLVSVTLGFNPQGYNLFVIPKAYLLLNLSLLAAVFAILYFLLGGSARLPSRLLGVYALVFIALVAVSSIVSVVPRISLVGKMPRYEGLLAWIIYLALFFLAARFMSSVSGLARLHSVLTALVLIVSVYGLIQSFGLDLIKWDSGLVTGRARSTLGNAATLGAFLALTLPFSASALLGQIKRTSRLLTVAALAVGLPALIMTRSRGAWLAFFLASLLFVYLAWRNGLIGKKISLPVRIASMAGVIALVIAMVSGFYYIESERGTASGRMVLWTQTVKAIGDRPIFGWGPQTFEYVFPAYITPTYEKNITRKTVVDDPHNVVLQSAFNTGFPATLALALLLTTIFRLLNRSPENNKIAPYVIGTTAGLCGYIVALQFHFSTLAVSPIFWVLAGSAVGAVGASRSEAKRIKGGPQPRYWLIAPLAAVVIMWSFVAVRAANTVSADMKLRQALATASAGDSTRAYLTLIEAEQLHPGDPYYPFMIGQVMIEFAENQRSAQLTAEAKKAFERALKLNPIDEYAKLGLADAEYNLWTIHGKQTNLERARKLYEEILARDKHFTHVKQKLRKILLESEQKQTST